MVVESNWRPIGASVRWGCDVFLSEELVAFRTPSTWTSMASHERCDRDAKCNTALLHPNFCQFEESILLMQLLGFWISSRGMNQQSSSWHLWSKTIQALWGLWWTCYRVSRVVANTPRNFSMAYVNKFIQIQIGTGWPRQLLMILDVFMDVFWENINIGVCILLKCQNILVQRFFLTQKGLNQAHWMSTHSFIASTKSPNHWRSKLSSASFKGAKS